MSVPTHHAQTRLDEHIRHDTSVGDYGRGIVLESRQRGLQEANRLGGDDMHQRSALTAREHRRINLRGMGSFAENEATARTTERLLGSTRHDFGTLHCY